MKNRKERKKHNSRREEIREMMKDPEKFMEKMGSEITADDVKYVHEIARDSRLDHLFDDLNIDKDQLETVKKQEIELSPESVEYPLFSTLYRDHDGLYNVEDLIYEYHDSILRDGLMIGLDYGRKFLVEDIQNKRFSKQDIMKMTPEEIEAYCLEERDEI